MDCLSCKSKLCKAEAKDCNGKNDPVVDLYKEDGNSSLYKDADRLVAGGKAGNLSRLEEIISFCRYREYKKVAIAYCYSMEAEALILRDILQKKGLRANSYRCTINGITEHEIMSNFKDSVNCNPVGQAIALNESDIEFVIEMGLCLGHDIIFHKYLEKPFTVFAVKDRVYSHSPLEALKNYSD